MKAPVSEASFRYVLNTFGPKGYAYWRTQIGGGPLIIPGPFESEHQLEAISVWDSEPGGTIRVFVFPIRETCLFDFVSHLQGEQARDFFVFPDGRTDPPFGEE